MRALGKQALVLLALLTAGPARAEDPARQQLLAHTAAREPVMDLWLSAQRHFDAMVELKRRVVPSPVEVEWKPRRLGEFELRAPMVALASADTDDDGEDELLLLSTRELVVVDAKKLSPTVRVPLPSTTSAQRSRDPVGTLWVAGRSSATVVARTSEQDRGIQLRVKDGRMRRAGEVSGYPACGDTAFELAPGKNYFDTSLLSVPFRQPLPASFWSIQCAHLTGPKGQPLEVVAVVDTGGVLSVTCEGCPWAVREFSGVGYAHAVVDVNRDGRPDFVTSRASAPGAGDRVEVLVGTEHQPASGFSRDFASGILGIAPGDVDGDGAEEIVVATRVGGTTKVELWLLNQ